MKIRRILVTAALILAGFLLQFGVFANIALIDTVPNLLLILTICFGFLRGKNTGMWTGFVCGLMMDIGTMSSFGFHMVIFILIGYITGAMHRFIYADYIVFPMIITAIMNLFYGIYMYVFLFLIRGRLNIGFYMFHVIIPEIIYTVVLTGFLYQFLAFVNKKLETSEQRSAEKFV